MAVAHEIKHCRNVKVFHNDDVLYDSVMHI